MITPVCLTQDTPGIFSTYICVVEGRKLVLTIPFTSMPKGPHASYLSTLPTEAGLTKLYESHKKNGAALVTLGPGEGVYIEPGEWHAAINLERCVSINISVAIGFEEAVQRVAGSIHAAAQRARQGSDEREVAFGSGMVQLVEDGIDRGGAARFALLLSLEACKEVNAENRILPVDDAMLTSFISKLSNMLGVLPLHGA
jgi:hypothetical protein